MEAWWRREGGGRWTRVAAASDYDSLRPVVEHWQVRGAGLLNFDLWLAHKKVWQKSKQVKSDNSELKMA